MCSIQRPLQEARKIAFDVFRYSVQRGDPQAFVRSGCCAAPSILRACVSIDTVPGRSILTQCVQTQARMGIRDHLFQ